MVGLGVGFGDKSGVVVGLGVDVGSSIGVGVDIIGLDIGVARGLIVKFKVCAAIGPKTDWSVATICIGVGLKEILVVTFCLVVLALNVRFAI